VLVEKKLARRLSLGSLCLLSRYLWPPFGGCTYRLRLFKAVTGQIFGHWELVVWPWPVKQSNPTGQNVWPMTVKQPARI